MGIILAFFHDLGYLHCSRDLLKIIRNGTAIFSGDTCNILWLILSGPNALFTAKFIITSNISSSVQRMSLIELPVLDPKSGNKTFSSSIPEIQLKIGFFKVQTLCAVSLIPKYSTITIFSGTTVCRGFSRSRPFV